MAVNPLDLQVNFSQMNQVGKQQSLMQGNEILRQDHATDMIKKDSEINSDDVPETKDLSEGPDKIKDNEKKKNNREKKNKKQLKKEEDKKPSDQDGVNKKLKDPDLGGRIDIIG